MLVIKKKDDRSAHEDAAVTRGCKEVQRPDQTAGMCQYGGKPAKESIEIRAFAVLLFTVPAMGIELPDPFLQQGGHGELWPEHTQGVQCAKNAHADAEGPARNHGQQHKCL